MGNKDATMSPGSNILYASVFYIYKKKKPLPLLKQFESQKQNDSKLFLSI